MRAIPVTPPEDRDLKDDEVVLRFQAQTNPQLISIMDDVRKGVFRELLEMDIVDDEDIVLSRDDFERVKRDVLSKHKEVKAAFTLRDEVLIKVDGIYTESVNDYHEHHSEWPDFNQNKRSARTYVRQLNTTASGGKARYKVQFKTNDGPYHFYYRGETLDWEGEDRGLRSLEELVEWKKEVDDQKKAEKRDQKVRAAG